jgi:hypothetical protein
MFTDISGEHTASIFRVKEYAREACRKLGLGINL